MYHLGAATHLVDDACAPPHSFVLDPNHRAYENWMMAHQRQMTSSSGGIYRDQFRVHEGHGGPEWSSSHTRGWVDECAHRAADMIPNAAVPPPDATDDPSGEIRRTDSLFRQAQQLTAGYLAFFFETVGGP
jgi:hypothetical protein